MRTVLPVRTVVRRFWLSRYSGDRPAQLSAAPPVSAVPLVSAVREVDPVLPLPTTGVPPGALPARLCPEPPDKERANQPQSDQQPNQPLGTAAITQGGSADGN